MKELQTSDKIYVDLTTDFFPGANDYIRKEQAKVRQLALVAYVYSLLAGFQCLVYSLSHLCSSITS
jgi:hypothetical protein